MRWALALGFAMAAAAACSSGQVGGATGGSGGTGTSASTSATGSGLGGQGSTDTWSSWAQGFFAMYCVECHGASDPDGRDFTKLSIVQAQKDEIRCGVAPVQLKGCTGFPPPHQFPVSNATGTNPKPTDAERDRLVAWIDAGAM